MAALEGLEGLPSLSADGQLQRGLKLQLLARRLRRLLVVHLERPRRLALATVVSPSAQASE